jgi:fermentation-respiration switch protein FrsA (DUF1100 family)
MSTPQQPNTVTKPQRWHAPLWRPLRILAAVYGLCCVLLWAGQGALLFPASTTMTRDPGTLGIPYEDLALQVTGGTTHGWYAPLPDARGVILFSHGNAGNLSDRVSMIARLQAFGFSVLAYDYGGYGRSTGTPSESRCYEDIQAMWNYLVDSQGIPPERIVLYGKSLGGGPTSELATRVEEGAVILESTFLSVAAVAAEVPIYRPFLWLLRHRFENQEKVAHFGSPLLVLHSTEDEVIPYAHGEALFDGAREPKQFQALRGGHNTGYDFSADLYDRAWRSFLDTHMPPIPPAPAEAQ